MRNLFFTLVILFFCATTGTAQSRHTLHEDTTACHISTADLLQQHEGWGVSLCWWAKMCGSWPDEKLDELIDWLVSPEGLNFNIFRYNIGGGDDPQWRNCKEHHMVYGKGVRAEMDGFQDELNGDYIWERDSAQRRVMLKIKERRPDAIFEAFSNSPPYFMTESGCVGGNVKATDDNLRKDCYEAFAHYLVDVCKHYKDVYGIEFLTLEPFNEPVTDYWYASGSQEGCHFSTKEQIAFIKVLKPILDESGLSTVIAASDETKVGQSVEDLKAYRADGEVLSLIGQWNAHSYSATNRDREHLSRLVTEINGGKQVGFSYADGKAEYKRENGKLPLWMSEVGEGGRGIDGNLKLALKLIDDERHMRPAAWIDWQYAERDDQWCLVWCNHRRQEYRRIKNYYIRQQFSRFIPVGSTFVKTDNPHVLAALTPDSKQLVVVMVNRSHQEKSLPLYLTGTQGVAKAESIKAYRTSPEEDCALLTADKVLDNSQQTAASSSASMVIKLAPQSVTTIIIDK